MSPATARAVVRHNANAQTQAPEDRRDSIFSPIRKKTPRPGGNRDEALEFFKRMVVYDDPDQVADFIRRGACLRIEDVRSILETQDQ